MSAEDLNNQRYHRFQKVRKGYIMLAKRHSMASSNIENFGSWVVDMELLFRDNYMNEKRVSDYLTFTCLLYKSPPIQSNLKRTSLDRSILG